MLSMENKANYIFDYYHPTKESKIPIQTKQQWNPYMNNEGSVMALAGKDFVIAAADKRLSSGYSIISRNASKLYRLTDKAILASSGMYADVVALRKYLKARIEIYKTTNKKEPSLLSVAQLLSVALYQRRFFPYYAFNVLCGQSDEGEFLCYSYDAVGSFEKFPYGCQGSGMQLIAPVFDKIYDKNPNINVEDAKNLMLEIMNGVAQRDIYTGDAVELMILKADGEFTTEEQQLRHD